MLLMLMVCPAGDMTGGKWGPLWDKLVFSKIRDRVGGQVKYMTTGWLSTGTYVIYCGTHAQEFGA